ncbi:cyclic nucleotide-binding domain-containing protein [Methylobacterium sp. WL64]|uniref:cyclic nucleotide-binding domain-containing protein n=1 Tax=Methylobacterium sp. WL64 TaxID=2603894 RepID=UPI001FEF9864|nr:cyclic nucleotide-binding domain-containing protein [Methylobacterium sp. WL64]
MSAPEIPFLAGLDAAAVSAVRARMVSMAVPAGRTLFEQGDVGDALYTLVSGAVGVSTRDRHGIFTRIARLRPPETFGEMALLSEAPRAATVMALRDSQFLCLTRAAFETVITEHRTRSSTSPACSPSACARSTTAIRCIKRRAPSWFWR